MLMQNNIEYVESRGALLILISDHGAYGLPFGVTHCYYILLRVLFFTQIT